MQHHLVTAARALIDADGLRAQNEAMRTYVERVTFATPVDINRMLDEILAADWMALPPWARNLAYRLACLQQPDNADLLREAAADLYSFGPDWDDHAQHLRTAADNLTPTDRPGPARDQSAATDPK